MNHRKHITLPVMALTAAAGAALVAVAGPLNPPAGPVAPTFKTLSEVEPRIAINAVNTPGDAGSRFKITQPGSYYLTGNSTNSALFQTCILIASSGVTIDLSGYQLLGGPDADGAIRAVTGLFNVEVKNGVIAGWLGPAVAMPGVMNARVEDVRVSHGDEGIIVGDRASVLRCSVSNMALDGLRVGTGSLVADCTASLCGGVGIFGQSGARISDCQANYNTGSGVEIQNGGTLEDSTASYNTFRGVNAWSEVTVRNCKIAHNGENGINGLEQSVVESCVIEANAGDGVHVGLASTVTGCIVQESGYEGVEIAGGHVADCHVSYSGLTTQASAGILVSTAFGTRVEGNTLTSQALGIQCAPGGCFVVRNYGRALSVAFIGQGGAGNTIGPIVAATGTISNTNPWANFQQ